MIEDMDISDHEKRGRTLVEIEEAQTRFDMPSAAEFKRANLHRNLAPQTIRQWWRQQLVMALKWVLDEE